MVAGKAPKIWCAHWNRKCRSKKECRKSSIVVKAECLEAKACRISNIQLKVTFKDNCFKEPWIVSLGLSGLELHRRTTRRLRVIRGHCKVARFCCKAHLEQGVKEKPKAAKAATRRGREPLTVPQLALLFDVVVNVLGAAWAGALMMIQLHLGERADCSRQISSSWFENLRPSAGLPCVNIEKVNGKTQERCVPLPRSFAELLWTWISKKPLVGGGGRTQWPWPGQGLAEAFQPRGKPCLLFPGRVIGGCICKKNH